jgi:hypothetical protein
MFYSKSTGGFYSQELHGDSMPSDVVEITEAEHQSLIEGQAAGQCIIADANGRPALKDPEPPTPEQLQKRYTDEVQRHLDAAAQALGYDHIASAVTYSEEPAVAKFQAEGRAFRTWRSLVWDYAYGVLDAVQAGDRPLPTIPELIGELPELELPAAP